VKNPKVYWSLTNLSLLDESKKKAEKEAKKKAEEAKKVSNKVKAKM
jgi:hypothetical protein